MSHGRVMRIGLLAVLLCAAVTACSHASSRHAGKANHASSRPTTTVPEPSVTATVADGATGISLSTPLGVSVSNGTFKNVTIEPTATNTSVPPLGSGAFNKTRTGWVSPSNFAPNAAYAIAASVMDAAGKITTHRWTFTTGAPQTELHTTTNVDEGATYGVGMPIIVKLNTPVPAAMHKAVTDRLKVTSTPEVAGGWHWFSDTEVHYRPEVYWPAHTQVSLAIDFTNLDIGNGVWGVDGRTIHFAIGDSHVSIVDTVAHTMTVQVNGNVVNTIPVSTGGPDHPTHNGIHVVNEKDSHVIMDSSTVGIPRNSPGGYYLDVQWAVRISNSGEYVHAAPWSVVSQGYANVSHGCVNVSTANAQWFYNMSMTGDVVNVINSTNPLQPTNGYGDWVVPWDQWVN